MTPTDPDDFDQVEAALAAVDAEDLDEAERIAGGLAVDEIGETGPADGGGDSAP